MGKAVIAEDIEHEETYLVESEKLDEFIDNTPCNHQHVDELEKRKEKQTEVVITMLPKPPPLFPHRLKKKADDKNFGKFMAMLKQLTINLPLMEALEQMFGYTKFIKDLVKKKRTVSYETVDNLLFGGAGINLMPLAMYKKLGLGDPTPMNIRLVMADRSVKRPVGILYDVLVKSANFTSPANFVILNCEVDFKVPIILGRPFLATGSVLIGLKANELLFRLNDEVVQFDVCQSMKQHKDMSIMRRSRKYL
ncbi:uncharacterized protein LOC124892301 [Capsicum annuum]|uniref:uncharacterized protein LOC107853141 n=1 Tax=Capsicum annuum TaxID=4072 RepID=UPI001FB0F7D5|nr:uncharacterized protein LOC107853141 [Capsicum annuum]XP_047259584.1 uncharacterized protein LOC124892301 [Capsicum annuum]